MKRIFFIQLLFLLLFGCSSDAPKEVAEKFIIALTSGHIPEAQKYATKETQSFLNQADVVKEGNENFSFKFLRDSIVADTAFVFFKEGDAESMLILCKINGQWKVNLEPYTDIFPYLFPIIPEDVEK